jgi:lysophospholipase L1-like esterase
VRLELAGDAEQVEIRYSAGGEPGTGGYGGGTDFTVWRSGTELDRRAATPGGGSIRLAIAGEGDRAVVYLPEGMAPLITGLAAIGGSLQPAPPQPRWVAYGDSITEGWVASGPSRSWLATAGRDFGFDTVNLGYAGSARGELASAEQIAGLDAAVISLAFGTNCWSRLPYSTDMMSSITAAFLRTVRAGHPGVPIVVVSPITRPDAEEQANRLGATLADLRSAMERAVEAARDELTLLIPGRDLIGPELLADGIHPGDAGHSVLAGAIGRAVTAACTRRGVIEGTVDRVV